MKISILRMLI